MSAAACRCLALALLGACAGTTPPASPSAPEGEAAGSGPEAARPAAVVEMTQAIRFSPDTVRVRVGDVVEWRNVSSGIGHTATLMPQAAADPANARLPAAARGFDSGNIPPGGAWRHRFAVAGTYVYYCTPHETVGMVGVILVTG